MTTTPFQVGQQVEVQSPDFSLPGYPLVWWPCTVTGLEPVGKLTDVQYRRHADNVVQVIRTGPRGGGKIRPA